MDVASTNSSTQSFDVLSSHTPQSSKYELPCDTPAQSQSPVKGVLSFVESASQTPQLSSTLEPPHTFAQSVPILSTPVPTKAVSQFPAQSATEPVLQSQPVLHVFELAVVNVP